MREIKFRFYDSKVSKRMIYHDPLERIDSVFRKWENTPKASPLMQYTGLKDKNGKEIYESDKVEFNDFDSLRTGGHTEDNILQGEVRFSCGAWIVSTEKGHYDLYTVIVNDEELEVIGNIYENPELLEE